MGLLHKTPSGQIQLLQRGHLHELQHEYLVCHGSTHIAGGQPPPLWSSLQATADLLLWCLEHLLPSFFTDLNVFRIFSLLVSSSCCYAAYFSFLKSAITEIQLTLLIGLALASSVSLLETTETGFLSLLWGSFCTLHREANLILFPLTIKTLPHKPFTTCASKNISKCYCARKNVPTWSFIVCVFNACKI